MSKGTEVIPDRHEPIIHERPAARLVHSGPASVGAASCQVGVAADAVEAGGVVAGHVVQVEGVHVGGGGHGVGAGG